MDESTYESQIKDFLSFVKLREPIPVSTLPLMNEAESRARRITITLNTQFHDRESIHELMEKLIGKSIPKSFVVFPPFYTEFGRNITIGERVFINSGCHFQDHGGIHIGDDCLIGHHVILATLGHNQIPEKRAECIPAPIHIGRKVWIGARAVIIGGVTIGDNSIIAAGAVVRSNVPANSIYGGVPARRIKSISTRSTL